MQATDISHLAQSYTVAVAKLDDGDERAEITIERRGNTTEDVWCVKRHILCLTADGRWVREPQPSSRTDEFVDQTRFTLAKALDLAAEHIAILKKKLPAAHAQYFHSYLHN